jgi:hypothetical protein
MTNNEQGMRVSSVQCQKKSLLINLLPLVVSYTWHNQTHNKKYYIIHNAVEGKGVKCNVLLLESLTIIIIAAAEEEGVNNDGIQERKQTESCQKTVTH